MFQETLLTCHWKNVYSLMNFCCSACLSNTLFSMYLPLYRKVVHYWYWNIHGCLTGSHEMHIPNLPLFTSLLLQFKDLPATGDVFEPSKKLNWLPDGCFVILQHFYMMQPQWRRYPVPFREYTRNLPQMESFLQPCNVFHYTQLLLEVLTECG